MVLYFQTEEALNYLVDRREFWAQQQPEKPEFPIWLAFAKKTSWNPMVNKVDKRKKVYATEELSTM